MLLLAFEMESDQEHYQHLPIRHFLKSRRSRILPYVFFFVIVSVLLHDAENNIYRELENSILSISVRCKMDQFTVKEGRIMQLNIYIINMQTDLDMNLFVENSSFLIDTRSD
jgi:hypothetical protein